ncbi:MAG: LysR substrate-binding domain-containing protein [Pseudonocardiaceae bacterium]
MDVTARSPLRTVGSASSSSKWDTNSDRLIDALRGGRLDAAIIAIGGTSPPGLKIHVVADESIVAAVSHSDDLAKQPTIPLDVLRDRALISLPAGTGIRSRLDDACASAGFTPHVAFEASSPMVLMQLAARGLGVAIVPASVANAREDLHPLTIVRPELRGRVCLADRRAHQPRRPRLGPTSSAHAQLTSVAEIIGIP